MNNEYKLSNEELTFFHNNGFIIIKNYLDVDEIDFYRKKIDKNYKLTFFILNK